MGSGSHLECSAREAVERYCMTPYIEQKRIPQNQEEVRVET